MASQIVIDFTLGVNHLSHVHRIRNFGEDLYRRCREDGWASISLAEVDQATSQLKVSVRSARRVRRTAQMIEKLLVKHFLSEVARLSAVNGQE